MSAFASYWLSRCVFPVPKSNLKYFFCILALICHFGIRAQKVLHGIGPGISFSLHKEKLENGVTNDAAVYTCFVYSPRVNLFEKTDFSVSAGLPVQAGATVLLSGDIKGFLMSVPAVINLNWGAGVTTRSMKKMGYFAGAGAGYLYRRAAEEGKFPLVNGLAGTVNAGIRIGAGKYRNKNLEIKMNCILPVQDNTPVWGFHALFTWWRK
ncbi:MAG: hypothetical protein KIT80_13820 [Chitinophagaceae bacterium]|nr:hypothetical protein [Chitinophagaceae bacterium]MCW5927988.1 hypothetical protein [Chitinophagaceae bacterium]